MKLCLSFFPKDYPSWTMGGFMRPVVNLISKAIHFKRNPRDLDYMQFLLSQTIKLDFKVIDAKDLSADRLKGVEEVVLLWPDGNGYGWFGTEKRIFSLKERTTKVTVLNGRRRYFHLSSILWISYLVRRFLERFWIGEIIFSILFLIISPFLVIWDLAQGHR